MIAQSAKKHLHKHCPACVLVLFFLTHQTSEEPFVFVVMRFSLKLHFPDQTTKNAIESVGSVYVYARMHAFENSDMG